MYTIEDLENLAEFMYLAYKQAQWEQGLLEEFIPFWDNTMVEKTRWFASAKIAFDFIKYK